MSNNIFQAIPADAIRAICQTLNEIKALNKPFIDTEHPLYQKLLRQTTTILHSIQERDGKLNIHNRHFDLGKLPYSSKTEITQWLNGLLEDCKKRHLLEANDPHAVPRLLKVEIINSVTSDPNKFNHIYENLITASESNDSLLGLGYESLTDFDMPGVSPSFKPGVIAAIFGLIGIACYGLVQKLFADTTSEPDDGIPRYDGSGSQRIAANDSPYDLRPKPTGLLTWLANAGKGPGFDDDDSDDDFAPQSNRELYSDDEDFDDAMLSGDEEVLGGAGLR